MNKITKRILDQIGQPELLEQLSKLPQSDINSLLLELYKIQADTPPCSVLRNYRSNRFVVPSAMDPVKLYQLEMDITKKAQENGIKPVLLSPVAPLGSCSSFGCVDQNKVLSAARGCEVLSDNSYRLFPSRPTRAI